MHAHAPTGRLALRGGVQGLRRARVFGRVSCVETGLRGDPGMHEQDTRLAATATAEWDTPTDTGAFANLWKVYASCGGTNGGISRLIECRVVAVARSEGFDLAWALLIDAGGPWAQKKAKRYCISW